MGWLVAANIATREEVESVFDQKVILEKFEQIIKKAMYKVSSQVFE